MESQQELKIYTGLAGRILKLMSGGCTQTQASAATGAPISYVSGLAAEIDFQEHIANAIQKNHEDAVTIDKNYTEIERKLSDVLVKTVGQLTNPKEVLSAIAVVNKLNRKIPEGRSANENPNTKDSVVSINIGTAVINNFTVNPKNEVVEVDGRVLETLGSKSLKSVVEKVKAIEHQKLLTQTEIQDLPLPRTIDKQMANYEIKEKVITINNDQWAEL